MAAVAPLSELRRVVEMTVHLPFMFVIGILGAKHRWAHRTGKVLNVVLAIQSRDV